ncbi:HAD family hydrolase [Segetibacter koreensis]|uniref:HAD family hydrolase n=1 Tax=Segetibacter koreensis TaxID=398037 RepID=UPI00037973D7|nr:HAD family phosphatase [Segetibacter koreensis]
MKEHKQSATVTDAAELPYKGVIFDMDGTLIISTEADYLAWEKVFNNYGKKLTYEDYQPILGVRSADVIKNHLGISGEEDVKRILKEKFDYFVDIITANPIKPVHAAETFLKSLANYPVKVALATSSRKEKMEMVLKQLNFLQYFDVLVTGDEVKNSKPAPDIFLKAADRLGLAPNDCFVVEDGPIGVAAAKNAKMKCVAITETHEADKLQQADIVIDSYADADFIEISRRLASLP